MKKLCLFLLMICLTGIACEKKDDLEPEPSQENKKVCEFDNPLTDLLWLQEMVSDLEQNKTEYFHIYQVNYEDSIGFLLTQHPEDIQNFEYTLINCEGITLYIGRRNPFNIDFTNRKLLWATQPDPRITIEDLYAQPLSVIQENIHGEWKLVWITKYNWVGVLYLDSTFIDIDTVNKRVLISGKHSQICQMVAGSYRKDFSFHWEYKEVYEPGISLRPPCYSTYVMQDNDREIPGWYFEKITNGILRIIVDIQPDGAYFEYYELIKVNNQ